VNSFHRTPLREERAPAALPTATPAPGAKPAATPAATNLPERNVVEVSFHSTPAVARKVINQIAGANQQFCIIRLLRVRNEKEKGPPRETAGETGASPSIPAASPAAKTTPAAGINFIVGMEKIETTARIEIVRFAF
jgi:hypothetical protein